MLNGRQDIEPLRKAGYREVLDEGGPYRMACTIEFGRDELLVQVRSADGKRIQSASAFTLSTFGMVGGQRRDLEFTSADLRDILALHVQLSAMAARRDPDYEDTPYAGLRSFVHRGETISSPFLREDGKQWLGYKAGEKTVLQNPASRYGDRYLAWRGDACRLLLTPEPHCFHVPSDGMRPSI